MRRMFPNAQYIVTKPEWAFWSATESTDIARCARTIRGSRTVARRGRRLRTGARIRLLATGSHGRAHVGAPLRSRRGRRHHGGRRTPPRGDGQSGVPRRGTTPTPPRCPPRGSALSNASKPTGSRYSAATSHPQPPAASYVWKANGAGAGSVRNARHPKLTRRTVRWFE